LNLAVINILPFPALDGGRILFLLIEKIKGSPVRRELENLIHNIGFLLLLALVLFITYKDVMRLF
jgi:regulator of sigma E protease